MRNRKINHVSTVRGLENSQDIRTVVVVDMKVNSNTAASNTPMKVWRGKQKNARMVNLNDIMACHH